MARAKKEAALTPEERLQVALVPDWEWPYKLPENWCWTRITVITDILNGFAFKSQHYSSAGIRIIRITNVQDGFIQDKKPVYYPLESQKEITPFMLKDGDFLMSLTGNVGRVAIIDASFLPAALNQRVACLRIKSEDSVRKEYIFYFCLQKQFVSDCIKSAKGSAQLNMSTEWLKEYPIPLPPLAEQQRIVDRIESLFAKLDEAKEKAQAVVDSFETRKAAILHKAFAGELTAKWREEHGVRMESWRWIPLKKSGSWYGGGTPSMSRSEYWENGTLLWVTAKDMKSDLIEDTLMHTNMFGVENSSANYIAQPAVLFVMRSGILRRTFPVCMVKKPFTVNQDIKALVPTDNIDLEYLFWGCKANEKRILESCMKNGTTVESINSAALRDFEIPIAGSNEQIEIVRILDAFFAKEQQAKEAAEKVLDQIDLMKKSILARAFRGELGTNDPSEESAVELLKRTIL